MDQRERAQFVMSFIEKIGNQPGMTRESATAAAAALADGFGFAVDITVRASGGMSVTLTPIPTH